LKVFDEAKTLIVFDEAKKKNLSMKPIFFFVPQDALKVFDEAKTLIEPDVIMYRCGQRRRTANFVV